ncbi:MAG: DUF1801 domain-containing protein [Chloroflexia bacterium]
MPLHNDKATQYIAALPSPQQEICQSLRDLILEAFPQMTEEFKWNFPVYTYNGKRICSLGGFKAHANMELFYGAHLKDPKGRIAGVGKNTRHIKFKSVEDIDAAYLVDLLQQSIALSQSLPSGGSETEGK